MIGHEDLLDQLALVVLLHQRGIGINRLLLVGPSGVGKTHIARSLALASASPYYLFDVTELTETGYHGINIPDLLREIYRASGHDSSRMERAVVVLDEFDKLRVAPGTDGVSADKRRGVQSNLLTLLGTGTPLSFSAGRDLDGSHQVSTDRMLIVCAGAFSGAPWRGRVPTTGDLARWGYMPELAERITERLLLQPLRVDRLAELYRYGPDSVFTVLAQLFRDCGYELVVADETFRYAASAMLSGRGDAGVRSGNGWIHAAARRLLVEALREGREIGQRIPIAPDELRVPNHGDGGDNPTPGPDLEFSA